MVNGDWIAAGLATILAGASLLLGMRCRRQKRGMDSLEASLATARKELDQLKSRRSTAVETRSQSEAKVREYLQLLDTLINTIPNPIYYKDADGVFLGCNRAFSKTVLGLPRNAIIGRRTLELTDQIPAELAAFIQRQEYAMLERGGVFSFEAEFPCADGTPREFLFTVAAVAGAEGGTAGSVGVMMDLTERNRAERDRLQKEKFQGVLETAGAVCHELNQPLQALSGYLELIQAELEPKHGPTGLLNQALAQVERLADITGKLQNVTRYETLTYGNRSRIIDIHRAAEEAAPREASAEPSSKDRKPAPPTAWPTP